MENLAELQGSSKTAFTELNVRQEHGTPHFVRLHDSVVKRLEAQLEQHPCGLLLGSIALGENCTIEVEEYEPAAQVEERIREWRAQAGSRRQLVGYYRSRSSSLALDVMERALFERCFPQGRRLVLLLNPPKAEVGSAMFFLGEAGKLSADRATVEFPFNLRELGAEDSPAQLEPSPETNSVLAIPRAGAQPSAAPVAKPALAPMSKTAAPLGQPASAPGKVAAPVVLAALQSARSASSATKTTAPPNPAQPASAPARVTPLAAPVAVESAKAPVPGAGPGSSPAMAPAPVVLGPVAQSASAPGKPAAVESPALATAKTAEPMAQPAIPPAKVATTVTQPATASAKASVQRRASLLTKIAIASVVVIASGFGLSELRVFDRQTSQAPSNPVVAEGAVPAVLPQNIPPGSDKVEAAESAQPSKPNPPKPVTAKPSATTDKAARPPEPTTPATQTAAPAPPPAVLAQNSTLAPAVPVQPAAQIPTPATLADPPASRKEPMRTQAAPAPAVAQSPKPAEPSVPSVPITPPHAIQQVAPELPSKALKSIVGELAVRLKVNVDASGKVISTEPAPGAAPVDPAVIGAVASAVKRWRFEPARRGDEKVAGDLIVSFVFRK